jgi:hypothetical protein
MQNAWYPTHPSKIFVSLQFGLGVGMELWMRVSASVDVDAGVALLHYVIYRIYIFNKYCCLPF